MISCEQAKQNVKVFKVVEAQKQQRKEILLQKKAISKAKALLTPVWKKIEMASRYGETEISIANVKDSYLRKAITDLLDSAGYTTFASNDAETEITIRWSEEEEKFDNSLDVCNPYRNPYRNPYSHRSNYNYGN